MTWEEFVRDWASKKISILGLELDSPLSEREVNFILAVCYEPYHTRIVKDAAQSIGYSKKSVDNELSIIYQKLPPSLEEYGRRGKYATISDLLSQNFSEQYGTIVPSNSPTMTSPSSENQLESPEGVVPIGSRFYMEPALVLKTCKEAIDRPEKSFLRVQAPRQRGKTSLLERIIEHAKSLNHRVVRVDLSGADRDTLQSFNLLLQWLCKQVCKRLDLPVVVSEHWDEDDDSKGACTTFFQEHILRSNDRTLLLSLDNFESIFSDLYVGTDFCGLLRSWKEEDSPDWQNIKVIILHAWYVSDDNGGSPLDNLRATLVKLPELTIQQVTELVDLHNLTWNENQIELLVDLVGFHPYLIRFALDRIAKGEVSLEDVLEKGHLPNGLFEEHLTQHLRYLERSPQLYEIVQKVLKGEHPLRVRSNLLKQLKDSGITKFDGSREIFVNKLYEQFFWAQIPVG